MKAFIGVQSVSNLGMIDREQSILILTASHRIKSSFDSIPAFALRRWLSRRQNVTGSLDPLFKLRCAVRSS